MSVFVFDAEANGLLHNVTKIHCVVFKEVRTAKYYKFTTDDYEGCLPMKFLVPFLQKKATCVIGHNIIGYDLRLFKKLVPGFTFDVYNNEVCGSECQIIDTMLDSKWLWPDRPHPANMPKDQKNKYGPHSLFSWIYRVSGEKPEIEDWEDQPLGVYLDRCTKDVQTTEEVFIYLTNEMRRLYARQNTPAKRRVRSYHKP